MSLLFTRALSAVSWLVVFLFATLWLPSGVAAEGARQTTAPALVPFTGTAQLTYLGSRELIPAKARKDLASYRQTTAFGVRDATHYRIDAHVQLPALDSGDQTIVANGAAVVRYDTVSGRAVRLTQGTLTTSDLLSLFLMSRYAPIGSATDQIVAAASRFPHARVHRLGQETVAGRATDVLDIAPLGSMTGGCASPGCKPKTTYFGVGRWWIDHEYGIVLRYQERNIPKNPELQRGLLYEVTSIAFGQGPADADLAYTPPVPVQGTSSGFGSSSSGGGGGQNTVLPAPPGLIQIKAPKASSGVLFLQSWGAGTGPSGAENSEADGLFGSSAGGFVYVKQQQRANGLPAQLMAGTSRQAGTCTVWTGTYVDGLHWLAMARRHISVLAVSDTLSEAALAAYAGTGICSAPITPQPTAAEVEAQTLDRLETEIDITRQILGWAIASAPSASKKTTLQGFDKRLAAFGKDVFTLDHPGSPYSGPGFPPPQKHPFKQNLDSLMGEIPLPQSLISQAEQGATSPSELSVLRGGETLYNELKATVVAMGGS